MKKTETIDWVFAVLGGLLLLFIVAPLVGMYLATPLADFFETAADPDVQKSIWLTLGVSFLATLVFSVAAIPLAYLLARKQFTGRSWVTGIINIPVVIPHSAAGIAVLGFVARDSVLGKFGSFFGIQFVGTAWGIALAMAFVSIPFLLNAAIDGFKNVPERLEKAAANLGASPIRVFFTVSLPLAGRSIVSGLIMMFARGMSEFGAVVIVAYHPMITPVLIYERFTAFGLKYARPVSVLFILISLAVFVLLRIVSQKRFKG